MSAALHESRAAELMTLALGVGITSAQSRDLIAAKLAEWQSADLLAAAEIAAPIEGRTPVATIRALIWENREGANHGPGRTWQEYSEVLLQEMEPLEGLAQLGHLLLERVKRTVADGCIDEWCEEVLEKAADLGVGNVRRVVYNPKRHGPDMGDVEPGCETWYWGEERDWTEDELNA